MNKKTYWTKDHLPLTFFFRGIMILSFVLAVYTYDLVWATSVLIGLFISISPSIIKKNLRFTLPLIFDAFIASISLIHIIGRLFETSLIIPWYDVITRFLISIFVAFISLTMIYILDKHWEGLKMDASAMAFVTIIFTMFMGVIFEFMKWFTITGIYYERLNQVLMINLSTDTIAGICIAIIGVKLIRSGTFGEMTDSFGDQIDKLLIHPQHDDEEKRK